MKTSLLKLANIVTTAGTQIRASINHDSVDEYAHAMIEGAKFPPIVAFHDGNQYVLADGFHRVMAASRNGFTDIEAEVHKGTKSDALKYALGANSTHGIKRTNADKRRSVELALAEWPKLSDRELAKICAVGNALVSECRNCLNQTVEQPQTRIGADGRERRMPKKKNQNLCSEDLQPASDSQAKVEKVKSNALPDFVRSPQPLTESNTAVVIPDGIREALNLASQNIQSIYDRADFGDLANSDLDEVSASLSALAKQLKAWRIK